MVSKFKLAHSDFALVVVMLVLVATVAIPVVMAMMVPVVMLMMPTIVIPMSMPTLDTMHYAAGDALAWIPLCQGRCASRQHDSGGGGRGSSALSRYQFKADCWTHSSGDRKRTTFFFVMVVPLCLRAASWMRDHAEASRVDREAGPVTHHCFRCAG
jgi:hypothetical protein